MMDTKIKNLDKLKVVRKPYSKDEEELDLCKKCQFIEYVDEDGLCAYCRYSENGLRQKIDWLWK